MGVLFEKQFMANQELNALDKAVKYAYLANDTLNALRYYQNKNSAYAFLGEKDSVAAINLRAAKLFSKHGYNYDAKIAFGCNYEYYIGKHDYKKAKEAFEAYKSTNFQGNTNYEDSKAFLLCEQGLYYIFINKLDSAYICLQQSLKLSKSYSNKYAVTMALAKYYTITNNNILAAKYALQSAAYNDSSLLEARNTQLQQMQAMYDYSRNQKLANEAEHKAKQRLNTIYLISIGCFLILLIASYFIRTRKHKLIVAQRLYKDSIQKLQMAKAELANLQNLNETKIASLIQEKETIIENLQKEINQYESIHLDRNLVKINKQLNDTLIYKKLAHAEYHPQEKITTEDWNDLEETLEEIIPSLAYIKLKLNQKEYRICLLTRLRFSPSTISRFMECNPSTISMLRKRMFEKLCDRNGSTKEFDDYIQHLT